MVKPSLIKKMLLFLLLILLLILIAGGCWYFYKTKIIKRPIINPTTHIDTGNPSDYPTQKSLLLIDFENYGNTDELYADNAHSGKYSYKVYGKNSFSAVISKPVADAGKEKLSRVGYSAYVYIFPENFDKLKADLVFSVVDKNENTIIWKNVALNPQYIEAGQWIKISGASELDIQTIPDNSFIKVYLWNDSKTKILIDDIVIVLGKDEPLKGDTTYCDNTPGSTWTKQFNIPPFPIQYLVREEINNGLSALLVKNKTQSSGAFTPSTKIYAGNFYNPSNNLDKILALENNSLNTYSFCETFKIFRHDLQLALPTEDSLWQTSLILIGKFRGKPTDDILIIDTLKQNIQLLYIGNTLANTCQANTTTMKLNKAWEGNYKNFMLTSSGGTHFLPFYTSSVQKASLLLITSDGNWSIYDFQKSNWLCTAKSTTPIDIWHRLNYNYTLHKGYFTDNKGEQILSIFINEKTKLRGYNILSFDRNKLTFTDAANGKTKILGIDTLNISDNVICIKEKLDNQSRTVLLMDKTWRNDIINIAFNDTTYAILNTLDFKGFKKDFNPKYYEYLHLVPGCFTEAQKTAILTVCYNYKDNMRSPIEWGGHSYLPNAVHIFTIEHAFKKDIKR